MQSISENLVPHVGNMSLLDGLTDFSEDSLTANCRIQADNVYLLANRLHNTVLIEYMAQTIAAHAKMSELPADATQKAKIGFLLGVKFFKCSAHWLDIGTHFSVTVNQDIRMVTGLAVFDCQVNSDSFEAQARLNVFQPPDVDEFLQELKSA